jgi:hypothetical protein
MKLLTGTYPVRSLAGIAVLAFSGAALATPTLEGTTTAPTGIDNLVIDGKTYDVTFSTTTFDSPFTFGTTASQDAATAIAGAFNTVSVKELGLGEAIRYDVYVDSGFGDVAGCLAPLGPPGPSGLPTLSLCPALGWASSGYADYFLGTFFAPFDPLPQVDSVAADFTQLSPSVPEPATLALFAAALVGVGLSRRRVAR